MSDEEFMAYYNIHAQAEQQCSATTHRQSVMKGPIDPPIAFDWRDLGGVSPVKNQGHCGSCWTFSTVGTLEAHSLIKYRDFTPLAEQQLVDCAQAFDNHGCNGGLPSHAFEYIMSAGGISTEDAYPYFAEDHNCTVDPKTFALQVHGGAVNITEGDEKELLAAVFLHGPVSIAFQVVTGFKDYKSGVYTSDVCKNGSADVNHAVVAVGFGKCPKTGKDYWIVKNSWGTEWGDEGYFKIERGVNMCGVAQCNSFPQSVVRVSQEPEYFMQ
jgi:cathepsin H